MATRTIRWTVSDDGMTVSPTTCMDGGVQGDHNRTRVEFLLPKFLVDEEYNLYIEHENAYGEYDTTECLTPDGNVVGILLPKAWTQYGGEATLRLLACKDEEVCFTFPVRVRYHNRTGAMEKLEKLFDGCVQELITRMKQIVLDFEDKLSRGELKGDKGDKGDTGDVSVIDELELVIDGGDAGGEIEFLQSNYVVDEWQEDGWAYRRWNNGQTEKWYLHNTTNETVLADHIVEQGTDGIWTYRKWASGLAECFGVQSTSVATTNAWGGTHYYGELESVKFPEGLFKDVPAVLLSIGEGSGNFFVTSRVITKEKLEQLFAVTVQPVEQPIAVRLSLEAKGRWKEE